MSWASFLFADIYYKSIYYNHYHAPEMLVAVRTPIINRHPSDKAKNSHMPGANNWKTHPCQVFGPLPHHAQYPWPSEAAHLQHQDLNLRTSQSA